MEKKEAVVLKKKRSKKGHKISRFVVVVVICFCVIGSVVVYSIHMSAPTAGRGASGFG